MTSVATALVLALAHANAPLRTSAFSSAAPGLPGRLLHWPRAASRLNGGAPRLAMAAAGDRAKTLGQLWRGAYEVMLGVPGAPDSQNGLADVCLAPVEHVGDIEPPPEAGLEAKGVEGGIPLALREYAVFALTAFDPPGTTRDILSNTAANSRLWRDLLRLPVAPVCAWRSFGFDLEEGWREDGFCLAFEVALADAARAAVLDIARSHRQGAIFEYSYNSRARCLERLTLGACLDMSEVPTSTLALVDLSEARLASGEGTEDLFARPWAGPPDGGIILPSPSVLARMTSSTLGAHRK